MTAQRADVVLLHGWPGTHDDFRRVRDLLPDGTQVLAPDLEGFGDAFSGSLPTDHATAQAQADRILRLIAAHDLDMPVVAGYDIGSRVAQAMAKLAPDKIRGLVVTPGYPGIGDRAAAPELQHLFWYQHFHRVPASGDVLDGNRQALSAYLRYFLSIWSHVDPVITDTRFEALLDAYARPGAFRASIAWYVANKGYAGSGEISVPTTVLWPEQDPLFPLEWADRLGETFTDVDLIRVPDCGHFVPLEAPTAFAEAVIARLGNQPARERR